MPCAASAAEAAASALDALREHIAAVDGRGSSGRPTGGSFFGAAAGGLAEASAEPPASGGARFLGTGAHGAAAAGWGACVQLAVAADKLLQGKAPCQVSRCECAPERGRGRAGAAPPRPGTSAPLFFPPSFPSGG